MTTISPNSSSGTVDECAHQMFRDPVKQEFGKHTPEECCGNLNVGIFMHTSSQSQEKKTLVFWEAFTVVRE